MSQSLLSKLAVQPYNPIDVNSKGPYLMIDGTDLHVDYDTVYRPASWKINQAITKGWMNLGYSEQDSITWESFFPKTFPTTCAALAAQLSEAACLTPGDIVIDVGCGYGVQDLHFAQSVPNIDIYAINVAKLQIEAANNQLKSQPSDVQRRIHYLVGDAVNLRIDDNFADKVLSLESAFHYNTREQFFGEAMRVLKPGGKLAITDVVITKVPQKLDYAWWDNSIYDLLYWLASWVQVGRHKAEAPEENFYNLSVYVDKLESAGFVNIVTRDLSERVMLWPNRRFAAMSPWWFMLPTPWYHRSMQIGYVIRAFSKLICQYVLVTAEKPVLM